MKAIIKTSFISHHYSEQYLRWLKLDQFEFSAAYYGSTVGLVLAEVRNYFLQSGLKQNAPTCRSTTLL